MVGGGGSPVKPTTQSGKKIFIEGSDSGSLRASEACGASSILASSTIFGATSRRAVTRPNEGKLRILTGNLEAGMAGDTAPRHLINFIRGLGKSGCSRSPWTRENLGSNPRFPTIFCVSINRLSVNNRIRAADMMAGDGRPLAHTTDVVQQRDNIFRVAPVT